MDDLLLVSVTCADMEEANRIAKCLVDEYLAACVHIAPLDSVYRWNDTVEYAHEIGLRIKTTAQAWPLLQKRIVALHSYATPAVVACPVIGASSATRQWILGNVKMGDVKRD